MCFDTCWKFDSKRGVGTFFDQRCTQWNRTQKKYSPGLWPIGVLDPFSFRFFLVPIFLIYISRFLVARGAALGTLAAKSNRPLASGVLFVTLSAKFSDFWSFRGEVEKTTNFRITKNQQKWQNQSTLWWPRLVVLSKSTTFEAHVGIDFSIFSKKCKSVK